MLVGKIQTSGIIQLTETICFTGQERGPNTETLKGRKRCCTDQMNPHVRKP